MNRIEELLKRYGIKYSAGEGFVTIACTLDRRAVDVSIYMERANFQVNIGDYLTIDKIEDQNIQFEDVEDLIQDLLAAIKDKRIQIIEHKFLGIKAYSIASTSTGPAVSHSLYETPLKALARTIGRAKAVGSIEFGL